MPQVCSRWLRYALGGLRLLSHALEGYKVTEMFPRCPRYARGVLKVCSRRLKFALCGYKVTEVCPLCLIYARGVPKLCSRE
jgi:hypothetical protein